MWTRSILPQIFTGKEWHLLWDFHLISSHWPQIVDDGIIKHARPSIIRNKTLWIAADSSAWIHHLQFQQSDLLARINRLLDTKRQLREIRFVMQPAAFETRQQAARTLPSPTPVAPEKKAQIKEITSALPDADVRQALERLWLRFQQNS